MWAMRNSNWTRFNIAWQALLVLSYCTISNWCVVTSHIVLGRLWQSIRWELKAENLVRRITRHTGLCGTIRNGTVSWVTCKKFLWNYLAGHTSHVIAKPKGNTPNECIFPQNGSLKISIIVLDHACLFFIFIFPGSYYATSSCSCLQ